MYHSVYVPVDNSPFSNRAIDIAVALGGRTGSRLIGSHVYAASMHDYRFKQMEYTLPEEYLQEKELARQRKIHDSLITMGLELISDSYLDHMKAICEANGLPFEGKMMDGKHYVEIIKDVTQSDVDLVILGAHGIGKVRDSQMGSVCTQVTRQVDKDVWVVKDSKGRNQTDSDSILVAIDGSPQSFGGLMTALRLAEYFNKRVEVIGIYDPYLHYSVFNGIVDVLSDKAKKVFRFEEQNQLHEEIIDTGLAQIYQSHLNVAEAMAAANGVKVTRTLLDGKAFQKILDHVRKTEPWLLIIGRVGVHSNGPEDGLGNTADNLLRMCPCDVYLSARCEVPKLDLKAEETMIWSDEAKDRMQRIPSFVRGIARTGILRMAIEQGHTVITNDLITEAMDRFMPKYTRRVTEKFAEELAFDKARQETVSICKHCGIAAKQANPVRCSVCGKEAFETVSEETIRQIAGAEGGVEEEATYDGRKLKWSREARLELRSIEDKYQMRRVKARVEKTARVKRAEIITLEIVRTVIEDELSALPIVNPAKQVREKEDVTKPVAPLIARDEQGIGLHSNWAWSPEAIARILRVPVGFMRDRTQTRAEEIATTRKVQAISLAHVEESLARGKQMMDELLTEAQADNIMAAFTGEDLTVGTAPGVCPFHAAKAQAASQNDQAPTLNEVGSIHYPVNKPVVDESF